VGYAERNLTSSNKLSLVDIREESEIPTFLGHQIKRDYGHFQAQYFYKYQAPQLKKLTNFNQSYYFSSHILFFLRSSSSSSSSSWVFSITRLRPPPLSQRLGCSSPMSLMAISSSQRLHLKLLAALKTLEEMEGLEPSRISPLPKVNLVTFYPYIYLFSIDRVIIHLTCGIFYILQAALSSS
jgi:hypothetical protein